MRISARIPAVSLYIKKEPPVEERNTAFFFGTI